MAIPPFRGPTDCCPLPCSPVFAWSNHATGKPGGTGLGHAIAQRLAANLDGSIRLHKRAGGGLAAGPDPERLSEAP
ncbi:Osmolarity sensory histidine kinase EnvZ [Hyphomicrobiales bacterium]|nr:Osmolarity sensory histidine kinase EnvZ [Hyphomicrobiales bacterium]CAH1700507.1 Osmolarity sensory histidine kinase EnvZ [Hyphomicrobiales bacterium]CAI0344356.1 hypothetical protein BO1005MUT1_330023 [Hyphomicrobiales bacterium]